MSVSMMTTLPSGRPGFLFQHGPGFSSTTWRPDRLVRPPGALSPEVKLLRREADHSLKPRTEVKNEWVYSATPHTSAGRGA
jgi:hypothetical protein